MNVILIVDDNANVRSALMDLLSITFPNVQILQAENGAQGVLLARSDQPDLILLDAEMPEVNGLEAARQLRHAELTRHIPIIAVSSGSDRNPIVSGLRAIADVSLPKPFSAEELAAAITHLYPRSNLSA